jgi:hypothetical protein
LIGKLIDSESIILKILLKEVGWEVFSWETWLRTGRSVELL